MANRAGIFHRNETISQLLTNNRKTNLTTVKDIEFIDTWMTFQYVNFIFNLPDGYLKDTMKIDNIQYPKLPIGKYVKQKKLDKVQFLEEVKKSVREYMNANPAK